jgi:hypothetical protein
MITSGAAVYPTAPIYIVCPSCKRPVTVTQGQAQGHCQEHGPVIPIRSAVANAPIYSPTR